jgi:ADP-ribose pyrophosphatase
MINNNKDPSQQSPVKPWKTLSTSVALDEKWFPVRKDVVRLPNGKVVEDYFVWKSPDIAFVAPFTSDGKFIICEQYRQAIDKVMLQFPAGGIDKGETPEQAALREMEEEAGYKSSEIKLLATVAPYPTKVECLNYLFLATNACLEGFKHEDEMEESRVIEMMPAELRAHLHDGSIQVAGSVSLALLALEELGL